MSERGIRPRDLELIVLIGTHVDDGYVAREKDYQEAEHRLKQLLYSFRCLVDKRLTFLDLPDRRPVGPDAGEAGEGLVQRG